MLKRFSAAVFTAAILLVGTQIQAQTLPTIPTTPAPPTIPTLPTLPPIVTGTAMNAAVKAGTIFAADSRYQTVGTTNYPKATVAAGTTLTYTLGNVFDLPASQTAESCALTTTASAQTLAGNAYTAAYTVSGASSAVVTVTAAGTHARKASGSAAGSATGIGSKSSTVSFTPSTPGVYLLSMNLGTLTSDSACTWGTFTNPATGAATAATAVVQVVSAADYALPETGWYWEPSQGGRGVAIEYYPSNNRIFMGIFGYGNGGESTWLVGACSYDAASRTCAGNLDAHRGGVTLAQAEGPVAKYDGSPGRFTLTFNQRNQPTLAWTGPTLNLVRYSLTGATADPSKVAGGFPGGAAIQTGWYWNEATGGRGWFVETARKDDGTMMTFTVGFMYRSDGSPVWYALEANSSAKMAPALFEGAMMKEFAGGSSMTSPGWTGTITNTDRGAGSLMAGIGSLAINFAAGTVQLTKFSVQ